MRITQLWAQWWLVSTSPFGDTNEAEQPGIRNDASRARRYHAWVRREAVGVLQVLGRRVLEQPHLAAVERPGLDGVGVEGLGHRGRGDEGGEGKKQVAHQVQSEWAKLRSR